MLSLVAILWYSGFLLNSPLLYRPFLGWYSLNQALIHLHVPTGTQLPGCTVEGYMQARLFVKHVFIEIHSHSSYLCPPYPVLWR